MELGFSENYITVEESLNNEKKSEQTQLICHNKKLKCEIFRQLSDVYVIFKLPKIVLCHR